MINIVGIVTSAASFLGVLNQLFSQIAVLARRTPWLVQRLSPRAAYETLSLDLALDIQDAKGARAVLQRSQRVRFLSDGEVVRDVAWGEGKQLARYSPRGARRVAVQSEGPKKAILLGLERRRQRGELASLNTRRLIKGGFVERAEYFETCVERPTGKVRIRVSFPTARPPHSAYVTTQPPSSAIPVTTRFAPDGKPYLSWKRRDPEPYRTYSLRWSW